MHELRQRPATEADIPFLLALRRETMDGYLAQIGADISDAAHRTRLLHAYECAAVLLDGAQPVGLLKVRRLPEEWEIVQIQLSAACQGRGVGRSVIAALIADASAAGASVKLGVLKVNPAKKLYERLGFTVFGEDAEEYFMRRPVTGAAPSKVIAPIAFDTERLRLRQWQASDHAPLAELNADPRVMEYFPSTLDREASDACIARWSAHIAERGWGLWAVQLRDTEALIGMVGLQVFSAALPFAPCVEVGWRQAHAYWGKGYATEAARGALRVGFEQIGLEEIVAMTALINRRSRAVMETLGMREDGATFEHPKVPEGSVLREHCLYRLSRAQWAAQNK
ncbi:MAG: GNAT family N-acetyltransferase [Pseudomonadota bacterium]